MEKNFYKQVQHLISSLQKNLECSVCLELLADPVQTVCGHHFCRKCVLKVLQTKRTPVCPLCKKLVSKRGLCESNKLLKLVIGTQQIIQAVENDTQSSFLAVPEELQDLPFNSRKSTSAIRKRTSGQFDTSITEDAGKVNCQKKQKTSTNQLAKVAFTQNEEISMPTTLSSLKKANFHKDTWKWRLSDASSPSTANLATKACLQDAESCGDLSMQHPKCENLPQMGSTSKAADGHCFRSQNNSSCSKSSKKMDLVIAEQSNDSERLIVKNNEINGNFHAQVTSYSPRSLTLNFVAPEHKSDNFNEILPLESNSHEAILKTLSSQEKVQNWLQKIPVEPIHTPHFISTLDNNLIEGTSTTSNASITWESSKQNNSRMKEPLLATSKTQGVVLQTKVTDDNISSNNSEQKDKLLHAVGQLSSSVNSSNEMHDAVSAKTTEKRKNLSAVKTSNANLPFSETVNNSIIDQVVNILSQETVTKNKPAISKNKENFMCGASGKSRVKNVQKLKSRHLPSECSAFDALFDTVNQDDYDASSEDDLHLNLFVTPKGNNLSHVNKKQSTRRYTRNRKSGTPTLHSTPLPLKSVGYNSSKLKVSKRTYLNPEKCSTSFNSECEVNSLVAKLEEAENHVLTVVDEGLAKCPSMTKSSSVSGPLKALVSNKLAVPLSESSPEQVNRGHHVSDVICSNIKTSDIRMIKNGSQFSSESLAGSQEPKQPRKVSENVVMVSNAEENKLLTSDLIVDVEKSNRNTFPTSTRHQKPKPGFHKVCDMSSSKAQLSYLQSTPVNADKAYVRTVHVETGCDVNQLVKTVHVANKSAEEKSFPGKRTPKTEIYKDVKYNVPKTSHSETIDMLSSVDFIADTFDISNQCKVLPTVEKSFDARNAESKQIKPCLDVEVTIPNTYNSVGALKKSDFTDAKTHPHLLVEDLVTHATDLQLENKSCHIEPQSQKELLSKISEKNEVSSGCKTLGDDKPSLKKMCWSPDKELFHMRRSAENFSMLCSSSSNQVSNDFHSNTNPESLCREEKIVEVTNSHLQTNLLEIGGNGNLAFSVHEALPVASLDCAASNHDSHQTTKVCFEPGNAIEATKMKSICLHQNSPDITRIHRGKKQVCDEVGVSICHNFNIEEVATVCTMQDTISNKNEINLGNTAELFMHCADNSSVSKISQNAQFIEKTKLIPEINCELNKAFSSAASPVACQKHCKSSVADQFVQSSDANEWVNPTGSKNSSVEPLSSKFIFSDKSAKYPITVVSKSKKSQGKENTDTTSNRTNASVCTDNSCTSFTVSAGDILKCSNGSITGNSSKTKLNLDIIDEANLHKLDSVFRPTKSVKFYLLGRLNLRDRCLLNSVATQTETVSLHREVCSQCRCCQKRPFGAVGTTVEALSDSQILKRCKTRTINVNSQVDTKPSRSSAKHADFSGCEMNTMHAVNVTMCHQQNTTASVCSQDRSRDTLGVYHTQENATYSLADKCSQHSLQDDVIHVGAQGKQNFDDSNLCSAKLSLKHAVESRPDMCHVNSLTYLIGGGSQESSRHSVTNCDLEKCTSALIVAGSSFHAGTHSQDTQRLSVVDTCSKVSIHSLVDECSQDSDQQSECSRNSDLMGGCSQNSTRQSVIDDCSQRSIRSVLKDNSSTATPKPNLVELQSQDAARHSFWDDHSHQGIQNKLEDGKCNVHSLQNCLKDNAILAVSAGSNYAKTKTALATSSLDAANHSLGTPKNVGDDGQTHVNQHSPLGALHFKSKVIACFSADTPKPGLTNDLSLAAVQHPSKTYHFEGISSNSTRDHCSQEVVEEAFVFADCPQSSTKTSLNAVESDHVFTECIENKACGTISSVVHGSVETPSLSSPCRKLFATNFKNKQHVSISADVEAAAKDMGKGCVNENAQHEVSFKGSNGEHSDASTSYSVLERSSLQKSSLKVYCNKGGLPGTTTKTHEGDASQRGVDSSNTYIPISKPSNTRKKTKRGIAKRCSPINFDNMVLSSYKPNIYDLELNKSCDEPSSVKENEDVADIEVDFVPPTPPVNWLNATKVVKDTTVTMPACAIDSETNEKFGTSNTVSPTKNITAKKNRSKTAKQKSLPDLLQSTNKSRFKRIQSVLISDSSSESNTEENEPLKQEAKKPTNNCTSSDELSNSFDFKNEKNAKLTIPLKSRSINQKDSLVEICSQLGHSPAESKSKVRITRPVLAPDTEFTDEVDLDTDTEELVSMNELNSKEYMNKVLENINKDLNLARQNQNSSATVNVVHNDTSEVLHSQESVEDALLPLKVKKCKPSPEVCVLSASHDNDTKQLDKSQGEKAKNHVAPAIPPKLLENSEKTRWESTSDSEDGKINNLGDSEDLYSSCSVTSGNSSMSSVAEVLDTQQRTNLMSDVQQMRAAIQALEIKLMQCGTPAAKSKSSPKRRRKMKRREFCGAKTQQSKTDDSVAKASEEAINFSGNNRCEYQNDLLASRECPITSRTLLASSTQHTSISKRLSGQSSSPGSAVVSKHTHKSSYLDNKHLSNACGQQELRLSSPMSSLTTVPAADIRYEERITPVHPEVKFKDVHRRNVSFVTTKLQEPELKKIQDLAYQIGANYCRMYSKNTTHVIVKTGRDLKCERTLKYFQGIAGKKWVVSYLWVKDSLERGCLLPEENYEVVGDTWSGSHNGPKRSRTSQEKCLEGFEICCLGPFPDITREQFSELVDMSGATLVFEPSLFPYNPNKQQVIVSQKLVQSARNHNDLFLRYQATSVHRDWLLDSIVHYSPLPFENYKLSNPLAQSSK